MVHYSIITKDQDNNYYGIKVVKEKIINNISCNYQDIKKLVDTCNQAEVDYDHFEDVLENFCEDYETF